MEIAASIVLVLGTAGASLPITLIRFARAVQIGSAVVQGSRDIGEYQLALAASRTDFDPSRAISDVQPSAIWVAISIFGSAIDIWGVASVGNIINRISRRFIDAIESGPFTRSIGQIARREATVTAGEAWDASDDLQRRFPDRDAFLRRIEAGSQGRLREIEDELEVVRHSEGRPTSAAYADEYDREVQVGNHTWRRQRGGEGRWCRFSNPDICVLYNPGRTWRPEEESFQDLDDVVGDLNETLEVRDIASGLRRGTSGEIPRFGRVPDQDLELASERIRALSEQLEIPLPGDRVLQAPWIGSADRSRSTSLGILRDSGGFFTAFRNNFPEDYHMIDQGLEITEELIQRFGWTGRGDRAVGSTIRHAVSEELAQRYGWPDELIGDVLVHHHIDNGNFVVLIPESLHRTHSRRIHGAARIMSTPE